MDDIYEEIIARRKKNYDVEKEFKNIVLKYVEKYFVNSGYGEMKFFEMQKTAEFKQLKQFFIDNTNYKDLTSHIQPSSQLISFQNEKTRDNARFLTLIMSLLPVHTWQPEAFRNNFTDLKKRSIWRDL